MSPETHTETSPGLNRSAAIVLAAGESRRMGEPKLRLAWQGRSLLERAVASAQEVADEVIVVLGAHAEVYRPLAERAGARVIENPAWRTGLSSSLRSGALALGPEVARVFVILPDQPFVGGTHLNRLLEAERREGADAVFSSYAGVLGAPALLGRALLARAEALTGDEGTRRLLRPGDRVAEVPLERPEDIDTPEDARRFLAQDSLESPPLEPRSPAPNPPESHPADPNPPDPSPERLGELLETLPYGVMLLEPRSHPAGKPEFAWRYANARARTLGLAPARSGDALGAAQPKLAESGLLEALGRAAARGEGVRFEHLLRAEHAPDGRERWLAVKLEPQGSELLATFEDVSVYKRLEAHIRRMAFQDELTGIYNRRYFTARVPNLLALARRNAWSVALLYFDLNGFKAINDAFGHRQGDRVLQAVAGRLRSISRESDIFFRSSGDEFALFLPEASEASARRAAERIAERLSEPLRVGAQAHAVGASIGVAVMPSAEATLDELLERADRAMYAAKARKALERAPTVLWSPELGG